MCIRDRLGNECARSRPKPCASSATPAGPNGCGIIWRSEPCARANLYKMHNPVFGRNMKNEKIKA